MGREKNNKQINKQTNSPGPMSFELLSICNIFWAITLWQCGTHTNPVKITTEINAQMQENQIPEYK